MLGWIPIVGPIIDGVVSIFAKYRDTELERYKTDAQVTIEETKQATNIIQATKDDIGLRLLRDLAITVPVVWSVLLGWDTIVANKYPQLMWSVPDYPESVKYIPYMAFVFLFGNIGLNAWRRR